MNCLATLVSAPAVAHRRRMRTWQNRCNMLSQRLSSRVPKPLPTQAAHVEGPNDQAPQTVALVFGQRISLAPLFPVKRPRKRSVETTAWRLRGPTAWRRSWRLGKARRRGMVGSRIVGRLGYGRAWRPEYFGIPLKQWSEFPEKSTLKKHGQWSRNIFQLYIYIS